MSRDEVVKFGVEQVLEIPPGDDAWVNGDVIARVIAVEKKTPPAKNPFWKCELGSDTSAARITLTMFSAPNFARGALIEISGKGIKRKEYRGTDELSIGRNVEVHVIESAPPPRQTPPPARQGHDDTRGGSPPPQEQQGTLPGTETAPTAGPLEGQTVGMVMKEARELVQFAARDVLTLEALDRPDVYATIWRVASALAKISNKLKRGDLAPFPSGPSQREAPAPASTSPLPAQNPLPAPNPPPANHTPPRNSPPPRQAPDDDSVPF